MKLHLMSDTHLEHYLDHGEKLFKDIDSLDRTGVDAVVLAGDITSATHIDKWVSDMQQFMDLYAHVIYVPGNHEYYGGPASRIHDSMRVYGAQLGTRFTMLDASAPHRSLFGARFLGGTMWYVETPEDWRWSRYISDFSVILHFRPWVYTENSTFVKTLQQEMLEGDIIVTHHLPSHKSVSPQFTDSPINRYFVHNMENMIIQRNPSLWLHGHTHEAMDYTIGATRIVCNPRGYPNEFVRKTPYLPKEIVL